MWRAAVVVTGLNGHSQDSGAIGDIAAGGIIARDLPTQAYRETQNSV